MRQRCLAVLSLDKFDAAEHRKHSSFELQIEGLESVAPTCSDKIKSPAARCCRGLAGCFQEADAGAMTGGRTRVCALSLSAPVTVPGTSSNEGRKA